MNLREQDAAVAKRCVDALEFELSRLEPALVLLQESPKKLVGRALAKKYAIVRGKRGQVTAFHRDTWLQEGAVMEMNRPAVGVMLKRKRATQSRVLVWNVHLRAQLIQKENIRSEAAKLRRWLRDVRRGDADGYSEIIGGDFNLDAFDEGIMNDTGFFAVRSLRLARAASIGNLDAPYFNPTWVLYGSVAEPLGTYFFRSNDRDAGSECRGGPWHVFDQVIVTPEHGLQDKRQVEVIDSINGTSLLTLDRSGIDNTVASDHLPVVAELAVT